MSNTKNIHSGKWPQWPHKSRIKHPCLAANSKYFRCLFNDTPATLWDIWPKLGSHPRRLYQVRSSELLHNEPSFRAIVNYRVHLQLHLGLTSDPFRSQLLFKSKLLLHGIKLSSVDCHVWAFLAKKKALMSNFISYYWKILGMIK